jgi:hypothetical protein
MFDAGLIHGATLWLNRYSKYWQAQFDLLAISLEEIEQENSAKTREPGRGKPAGATLARGRKQAVKSRLEMSMSDHQVVTPEAWEKARKQLVEPPAAQGRLRRSE